MKSLILILAGTLLLTSLAVNAQSAEGTKSVTLQNKVTQHSVAVYLTDANTGRIYLATCLGPEETGTVEGVVVPKQSIAYASLVAGEGCEGTILARASSVLLRENFTTLSVQGNESGEIKINTLLQQGEDFRALKQGEDFRALNQGEDFR